MLDDNASQENIINKSDESNTTPSIEDESDSDDDYVDNPDLDEEEEFILQISKEQKFYDKASMFTGVWNVILTSYLVGGHHEWLPHYYTVKAVTLLPFRYVIYNSKKWHYFMLDFCYYANFILLFYLWVVPYSAELFMVLYALTHGPLIWAVPLFGNALVFHSADKMTSAFIHLSPPLLTHTIRYYLKDQYGVCQDEACEPSIYNLVLIPTAAFIAHEMYYFFVVGIIKRRKMKEGEYLTSFKFLQGRGLPGRVINFFGPSLAPVFYVILNGLYALLTIVPAYFFWRYYWLNAVFLISMLSVSLWNGASFYVEIFTRKHEEYTKMGEWDIRAAEKKQKDKKHQK
eukprot:CFRG6853T1